MHHHPTRCALRVEHPQDLCVCIPIVDDQRLVLCLGEGDMCRERLALGGMTGGIAGAVEVETGLPDRTDAWISGQSLDGRQFACNSDPNRAASFGWIATRL